MLTYEQHLDNLSHHIDSVRQACMKLGRHFISTGRPDFGRQLIARGYRHDASKFSGIEWDHLHAGNDIDQNKLLLSIRHHQLTNDHHPEYWGDVNQMPEICLAEMVCDWAARSGEFGNDIRQWIKDNAIRRFKIRKSTLSKINGFVDILFENHFSDLKSA